MLDTKMLIKKRFPYLNYESKNFSSMTKDSTKYLNLSGVQILESVNLFWRGLAKVRPQAPPAFIFFLFDFPEERLPPLLPRYLCCFFFLDAFYLNPHHT